MKWVGMRVIGIFFGNIGKFRKNNLFEGMKQWSWVDEEIIIEILVEEG